jgi:hypothetical protein
VSDGGGDGAYGSPPGTLYSPVGSVSFDPSSTDPIRLSLDHVVPRVKSPGCSGYGADTQYIKTVTKHSALLSAFWGRPISLEACVLLPLGFDEHPTARYPTLIAHGHYSAVFNPGGRFDPNPPTPNQTGYASRDRSLLMISARFTYDLGEVDL